MNWLKESGQREGNHSRIVFCLSPLSGVWVDDELVVDGEEENRLHAGN